MNRLLISLAILLVNCNYSSDSEEGTVFPSKKDLSKFQNTDFVLTPEHKLTKDRNQIYCATFLFAWDEIRNLAKEIITIDKEFTDLSRVNESTSFINTLEKDEISIESLMEDDIIRARAYFRKSLPFKTAFKKSEIALPFKDIKVDFFGCTGRDHYELTSQIKILYFKDEDNFILELSPSDASQQIIIYVTETMKNSFGDYFLELEKLEAKGLEFAESDNSYWRSDFLFSDVFAMPSLSFNIENDYEELLQNVFNVGVQPYKVVQAYQQIAFVLNENGAEIESDAVVQGDKSEEAEQEDPPQPKRMICDQPFLIMLKRRESKNPYFAIWVEDAELMKN